MCSLLQLEEMYEKEWYDNIYVPFFMRTNGRIHFNYGDFNIKSWNEWFGKIASSHPNLSIDFINQHLEIIWNWVEISKHPNITMDIIKQHPDSKWDWSAISENPNITIDIINQYPEKLWNWDCVSRNPSITIDIIKQYPKL